MCRYAYTHFESEAGTKLLKLQLRTHDLTLRGAFATGGTEGFVAENDKMAILAFRGTTDQADWNTNLKTKSPRTIVVEGRPPVCVHEGFFRAYSAVAEEVRRLLDGVQGKPIYITGHSLGGAVAVVATASLPRDEIAACYTYGCPRVGDRSLDAYVKPPHYRIVNGLDVVPLIPFTVMRYHHGGDARYIKLRSAEAARWNRPVARALLVNLVALSVVLLRKTPAGVRDHSIELYCQILFGIARARGGWK
jgi:pimeloyl-ACP methyl ester carboxylesterase